ncbi:hypothetical protein [Halapricum desulfuricans]|nr:hypothetical protein [Halapricum desulfuricans]
MVEIGDEQLVESDEHGRQRSVVFAVVLATSFLALVAGTVTLLAESNLAIAIGLLAAGVALLAVGAAIAIGEGDEYLFE